MLELSGDSDDMGFSLPHLPAIVSFPPGFWILYALKSELLSVTVDRHVFLFQAWLDPSMSETIGLKHFFQCV